MKAYAGGGDVYIWSGKKFWEFGLMGEKELPVSSSDQLFFFFEKTGHFRQLQCCFHNILELQIIRYY